ncbi:hypothetical protein GCM10010149_08130 [Nonomuraea roseoviolacea subsp. roseoviolacea]|uniref:Outer membrane murein-binding lipoprotein Lpp n=1 Tax=Nonomuraea roseoviolacea subsp. carminata TaxID=160689 RepID=A0ABT1K646_9ACTN|nr:hypothetical protein [Nonomuraea roseoviolacea]MCP2349471.1 outer membrane murein-binding lipoprotein Lpp [Nonomuraea roseoviolacea subsp. carminata]
MASAPPTRFAINFVIGLVIAVVAFGAASATAAPKPSESELRAELKHLNAKVDKLIESYNAKRVELAEAQRAAETAGKRLTAAEQAVAAAESRVAQIAQMRYQSGDPAVLGFVFPGNTTGAAVLEQMIAEQQAVVRNVARARDEQREAAEEATALAARIRTEAADVARRRDEAQDVIDAIEKKLKDLVPVSTGRRSDGTWAPELPSGSDNITPRTRAMRALVEKNFSLPFTVGCFRSGSSGEHPLGRACDFMMSTGGTMPSAANKALGDRVAAWALENRAKLGVKYVIWQQRINMGSGWRAMEDRGSITENHFDHVHISMN